MKTIAFIPLRIGSKTIPFKNIKAFCDKPLACYALEAAMKAELVDKVYIAFDDDTIREVLGWWNEKLHFLKVPEMNDACMQERPMLEFAKDHDFDRIVLLQATTPYMRAVDIDQGISLLSDWKFDSVISVCRQHRFLWGKTPGNAYPLNYKPEKRPRRQDWDGLIVENGAFFVTTKESLMKSECRISGNIGLYEMPAYTYFEIDDETDWLIAEEIYKRRILNG